LARHTHLGRQLIRCEIAEGTASRPRTNRVHGKARPRYAAKNATQQEIIRRDALILDTLVYTERVGGFESVTAYHSEINA
jgi:hypothetical protein